ncbi:MAG: cation transporter [Thermodesulfovibrionales bacterium]|nr:cation transporter [Thermodesulfovibrionales bacterium]
MATLTLKLEKKNEVLYRWAYVLALITIFYNILEGVVSVFFGIEGETLVLLGFGIDSFVEVISGIGIWHMIRRIRRNNNETYDKFEKDALKVTGTAFYILTAGLIVTASINLYRGHKPETTLWGIIISLVSILSMWLLLHYKIKVGRQLNSQAILADANCTKACMYLSVVLFLSSLGYELTGIGGLDSLGAIAIAALSFREGREAFQKAKGNLTCGCNSACH